MEEYHGIVVDTSQKDNSIFNNLNILSKKKEGNWTLYKIEVSPENIEKVIGKIQDNMKEKFYFHFYRNNELIIVFRNKIFRVNTNKNSWKGAIAYGES